MMFFDPRISIAAILIIFVLSVAALLLVCLRARSFTKTKRGIIISLRFLVLSILMVILLNPVREDEHKQKTILPKNIVLLDNSTSMNVRSGESRWDQMMTDILPLIEEKFDTPVEWILFDSSIVETELADLKTKKQATGLTTYLVKSIEDAIQTHNSEAIKHIVVCSDGRSNDSKRAMSAIAASVNCGADISVMGYGHKSIFRNASITNVDFAANARPKEKLTIYPFLNFAGIEGESYSLKLYQDGKLIDEKGGYASNGTKTTSLNLTTGVNSSAYKLVLSTFQKEQSVIDNQCEFEIEVSSPQIRVLYMEGSREYNRKPGGGNWFPYKFIEQACLKTGEIEIDCYLVNYQATVGGEIYHVKTRKKGYPKTKDELDEYDVVICSDINRTIFSKDQIEWTRDLVAKNGGGFCMIGGIASFGSGGWDKTVLEKVIPVDMNGFGKGEYFGRVKPTIPKESLNHPIWQVGKTSLESMEIIKTHPSFNGTNLVNRAKPGATVLAYWKARNNMPLICVQSYGKGRSMAFTSDAAGGWGVGYQDRWGPNGRNNEYYNKFWANTILWLAENSINNKNNKLIISANKLNYFANNVVEISALVGEKDVDFDINARLTKNNKESIKFKSLGNGKYKGSWTIPDNYLRNSATIIVSATNLNNNKIYTDSIKVNIIPTNNEFINSDPDFELLKKLMAMTGGKNLKTADELKEMLQGNTETKEGKLQKATVPIWDKWYLWSIIILLWSAEWIIRKWG